MVAYNPVGWWWEVGEGGDNKPMLPNLSALSSNIEAPREGTKHSKVHVSDSTIDYMVKFASTLRHHSIKIDSTKIEPTSWYFKLNSKAKGEKIRLTDDDKLQARYYYEQIIIADLNRNVDAIYELVISIEGNTQYEYNDSQPYLKHDKKWEVRRRRLVLLHRWLTFLRRNKFSAIFTFDQITDPQSKEKYAEWLQTLGNNVKTDPTEIDRINDIEEGYSAFKICLLAELHDFDEVPKDTLLRSQLFFSNRHTLNPDKPISIPKKYKTRVHNGSGLDKVLPFLEMVFALLKSSGTPITKYSLKNDKFNTTSFLFRNAVNIVQTNIKWEKDLSFSQEIETQLKNIDDWVYLYNRWMITNDEKLKTELLNLIDSSLKTSSSSKASPSSTSS